MRIQLEYKPNYIKKCNNDPEKIQLFEYDSSAKDFDGIIQGLLGNCRDFKPDDLERLDLELSESQMKELAACALQDIQDNYKLAIFKPFPVKT